MALQQGTRHSLYRSKTLHVFAVTNGPDTGPLVIGFQNMIPQPDLDLPGFGESIIGQQKLTGVFFNCADNSWWQYEDMQEAISSARKFAEGWPEVVTYGSSMGAYGALRFASELNAARSVAFSPQFSIQRPLMPFENRYQDFAKRIHFVRDETQVPVNQSCKYIVVYDPLYRIDRLHVEAYRKFLPITDLRINCSGHPSLKLLADYGVVRPVALSLLLGRFDVAELRRVIHEKRRSTPLYWKELAFRLIEHRHYKASMSASQNYLSNCSDRNLAQRFVDQLANLIHEASAGRA